VPLFVAVRTPELLAPGGSFLAAYHALEAGADGVYLGLKEFSARQAAANFSLEQLRRLRGLAGERGRKLYVALNTVVRDAEVPRVAELLGWIEALGVDGVIIQDLGVAELARRLFPRLPLHASTQMAVHNAAGAGLLAEMGFRRVILSRELTREEIARLRAGCPGIELEVFVHGALCYSLSGACLASWAITGRSGNRGECAQICRSSFGQAAGGDAGHCFSCRDLFAGREVIELVRIGVDALKIEGRMKSPEYGAATVRLYRALIDAAAEGRTLSEADYQRLARDAALAFAREPTSGWLDSASGTGLLNPGFPGHRGARLGVAEQVIPRRAGRPAAMRLKLEADLALRDGVGYLDPDDRQLVAFSVHGIRRGDRAVKAARAGQTVEVELPEDAVLPRPGDEARQLSSRSLDLREPREGSFPPWRVPVEATVEVRGSRGGDATLLLRAVGIAEAEVEQPITLAEARQARPFVEIMMPLLAESGESLFRASRGSFANRTDLPDDAIFVPPSQLKRARTLLYEALDADFARRLRAGTEPAARGPDPMPAIGLDLPRAPDRALLSPRGGPVPFASLGPDGRIRFDDLARFEDFVAVPLPTFMADVGPWVEALRALCAEHPGERLLVGLGNPAHLAMARALADQPNVAFFVDFHLYVANRWTAACIAGLVPRLAFVFSWIEGEEADHRGLSQAVGPGLLRVGTGFRPPLFYSRGCFAKHVLFAGSCPARCPKRFSRQLRQGAAGFEVVVSDCITYLFVSEQAPGQGRAPGR
jgi:putative protease